MPEPKLLLLIAQPIILILVCFVVLWVIKSRKYNNYSIRYSFSAANWDEGTIEKAIAYWEGRGFVCRKTKAEIFGERGSENGNLNSYDMKSLICGLHVTKNDSGKILSEMDLDGRFQHITNMNKLDFILEQVQFRRALDGLGEADFVPEYRKQRRSNFLSWFTTESTYLEWKNRIETLAEGEIPPAFEVDLHDTQHGNKVK